MTNPKRRPVASVTLPVLTVRSRHVQDALERAMGEWIFEDVHRLYKYADGVLPTEDQVREAVLEGLHTAICEGLAWPEDPDQ